MEIAQLIKEYLSVLISWPVAIFVVAVILVKVFRTEIARLIGRIKGITYRGGAGEVSVSTVEQDARTSGMLIGKAKEHIVNTIIRPLAPELVAALERICDSLRDTKHDVRSTLYLPWPLDSEYLVQLTPYVPHGFDKTGRLLSKRVGTVGRAFREGRTILEIMAQDPKEFERKHVEQWGFAAEETERLKRDRQSYLAIPLRVETEILVVAFFDSSAPDTFSSTVISHLEEEVKQLVSPVTNLYYQLGAFRA